MSPGPSAVVTGGAGFTPPLQLLVQESQEMEDDHESLYYVYILRSLANGSWYIGCTSDLQKRLSLHQERRIPSTKWKGPWALCYYEAYCQKAAAYRREHSLKQFGGAYRQLKWRLSSDGM